MELFKQRLIDEFGIAETRAPEIAKGVKDLFYALAQLDNEQFGIIKKMGLRKLLNIYSATEEQRMLFLRPKWKLGHDDVWTSIFKKVEFIIESAEQFPEVRVWANGLSLGCYKNSFEARLAIEDHIDKEGL